MSVEVKEPYGVVDWYTRYEVCASNINIRYTIVKHLYSRTFDLDLNSFFNELNKKNKKKNSDKILYLK